MGSLGLRNKKNRVKFLLPFLVKELDKLIITDGKPIEVRWIGRKWQTNKTLSDINIKFFQGKILAYQPNQQDLVRELRKISD